MLSTYSRLLCKLTAVLAALCLTQMASAEADAERGKVLADTCKGCHAVDSYNNVYPTYHVPKVAGQNAGYLASALTLYRDGARLHPTMVAQAASLSDQDIQDIAAYMAASGGQSATPESAPETAPGIAQGSMPDAGQVCAACHGLTGISPIPTNPNLAGQYADYLEQALAQYKRGDRKGPNAIAMQAQLLAVSDEDLAAIAAYYAGQSGLNTLVKD
jgi:cytochrome c553